MATEFDPIKHVFSSAATSRLETILHRVPVRYGFDVMHTQSRDATVEDIKVGRDILSVEDYPLEACVALNLVQGLIASNNYLRDTLERILDLSERKLRAEGHMT